MRNSHSPAEIKDFVQNSQLAEAPLASINSESNEINTESNDHEEDTGSNYSNQKLSPKKIVKKSD